MQDLSKRLRTVLLLSSIFLIAALLALQIDIALPATPDIHNTWTPLTQPAPQALASYDVLGHTVSPEEAEQLLQTEEGKAQLSPENGAIAITEDLLTLGRKAFYAETFRVVLNR